MLQQNTTKEDGMDAQAKRNISVLMISTDRKIFETGSAVQARILEYGRRVDRLDVVVFSAKTHKLSGERFQLSENVWAYPTNSSSRFLYISDAIKLGKKIIKSETSNLTPQTLVTCQDPFETGLVGMKIAKKFNLPLHIQIHTDFLSPYFKTNILNKIRVSIARKVLVQADGIRAVSKRIVDSLKAESLNLKAEPTILPIFVDANIIENTPAVFDLRAKYSQFEKIILVASRLEKEKCVDTAINVFLNVVKEFPKLGLVIVGDGSERRSLELRARSLELGANIIFEGWQDDLNSYYKGADVFLNTSLYEGYGMSLVEAGLNKLPIVTTDVGIAGSLLKHTQHTLICTPGDVPCLSDCVLRFIKDKEGARAMGLRAYTRLSEDAIPQEEYYNRIVEDWAKTSANEL